MSYTVTLCDILFNDITDKAIHLEATTPVGTVLSSKSNSALARGYGATLAIKPARQRFNIEISTVGTRYAPLVIEDINGDRHPQTIDVVLLTTPAKSSGRAPAVSADVQKFIGNQGWSDEETAAVYSTIRTLSYLRRQTSRAAYALRQHAEQILTDLQISPKLIMI